jgi:predicted branched-subunit amino acid permease
MGVHCEQKLIESLIPMKRFQKGLLDGIPICLGYLSVSFAFGISAVQFGLTPWEALMISMSCVTSAGQLAAVPIIAAQGSLIELAVSQLVINLRYALMSISLSQKMDKDMTTPHRMAFAFINTDEVFAVASSQGIPVNKSYLYGLIVTPWLGWSVGTLLGALAGNILPAIVTSSLSVAIYGMFIAIVIPEMKASRPTAICVCIAVALSCGFYFIPMLQAVPSGFVIIICACIASIIMAIVAPIPQEVPQ